VRPIFSLSPHPRKRQERPFLGGAVGRGGLVEGGRGVQNAPFGVGEAVWVVIASFLGWVELAGGLVGW
jgi:hypothetical protein